LALAADPTTELIDERSGVVIDALLAEADGLDALGGGMGAAGPFDAEGGAPLSLRLEAVPGAGGRKVETLDVGVNIGLFTENSDPFSLLRGVSEEVRLLFLGFLEAVTEDDDTEEEAEEEEVEEELEEDEDLERTRLA